MEFYHDKQLSDLSLPYSELQGKTCNKLPVIRCYGSSPSGQKLCAHIHGVLPYFFIEYPFMDNEKDANEIQRTLRSLAQRLDSAISRKSGITNDGMHIFDIKPITAKSIYGYRTGWGTFLKIVLINPADVAHAAEVLLSGLALGSQFQPFEIHIPFLLQFCADYNLHGMNYLEASAFRMRGTRSKTSTLIEANNQGGDPLQFIWTEDHSISQSVSPRQTSSDVEVDISAADLVNHLQDDGANPGLDFLWEEEKVRRERLIDLGSLGVPSVPSPDDLLPLTGRPLSKQAESEQRYVEQFRNYCAELDSAFRSQAPTQSETSSQKSSITTISNYALQELCSLASIAEEPDVCLTQSLSNVSSSFNRSVLSSAEQNSPIASSHDQEIEDDLLEQTLVASAVQAAASESALFGGDPGILDEDADGELPDFSMVLETTSQLQYDEVQIEEGSSLSDLLEVEDTEDLQHSEDSQTDIIESTFDDTGHLPRLPQLDGVEDTDESVSAKPNQNKRRRLRLGLRLKGAPCGPRREAVKPEPQNNPPPPRNEPPSRNHRRRLGVRNCSVVVQPLSSEQISEARLSSSLSTRLGSEISGSPAGCDVACDAQSTSTNSHQPHSFSEELSAVAISFSPRFPSQVILPPGGSQLSSFNGSQDFELAVMKFIPEDSQKSETTHILSAVDSPHRLKFRREEATFSSSVDNQELNLTVLKLPVEDSQVLVTSPEQTQVTVEVSGLFSDLGSQVVTPLTKNLGEPDWDLHSSLNLTHASLVPPTFKEVEISMEKRKRPSTDTDEAQISLEPLPVTIPERVVDLSASISGLWWTSSLGQRASSLNETNVSRASYSRRAVLPLQENHLCLASLELMVHSRHRVRLADDPGCRRLQVGRVVRETEAISLSRLGGYFPQAQMDPIATVSLTIGNPWRKRPASFLLINKSIMADRRLLKRLWTTAGGEVTRSKGIPWGRAALVCDTEIELLNWVTYLVQSYDPDILIGYDVERRSWGYLVERAATLNRVDLTRDISRLATDLMLCVSCQAKVEFCSNLLTDDSSSCRGGPLVFCGEIPELNSICSCASHAEGKLDVTRRRNRQSDWPCEPGAGRTGGSFACPGRVVLSIWRILMHEASLQEYSFESAVFSFLNERTPHFSDGQLTAWLEDPSGLKCQRPLDYWMYRSRTNLRLLNALDLIGRTSEFARVFGIEFFHVLSRGSQYRVESLLLRTARRLNFLLPSPTVVQRAHQRALEAIPLNLEPVSRLHVDGPIAVLDFQSLYPSVAIAYNYCYSTAVGRLVHLVNRPNEVFSFGCLEHQISVEELKVLKDHVTVAPNGVVFVRRELFQGVLPRLWRSLLASRLMVKDSLKLYSDQESLTKLLDARQLGLKLIANVMFGYTAASFSGRMPCVEVGDSIVHKSRETLERAIRLVEQGNSDSVASAVDKNCDPSQPRAWVKAGAHVVYGDTDSLFVKFPGLSDRKEAFRLAQEIADAITNENPAPIKLKLEKIYYPCLLEAKKRYVGYSYESAEQSVPKFDAKGIETIRRDSAPFVGKVLESSLRLLFDQFTTCDHMPDYHMLEAKMRHKVRSFAAKLISGRVPFSSCLLARAYQGTSGYRPGAAAPALQVARRLMSIDPGREPLIGERVTYYLAPGRPSETLIGCVRASQEVWPVKNKHHLAPVFPPLNLAFYLDHQLLPPLRRFAQLFNKDGWNPDSWLNDLPRLWQHYQQLKSSASSSFSQNETPSRQRRSSSIMRAFLRPQQPCPGCGIDCSSKKGTKFSYCQQCLAVDPNLTTRALITFGSQVNVLTSRMRLSDAVCSSCLANCTKSVGGAYFQECTNLACANLDRRRLTNGDFNRLISRAPNALLQSDAAQSWCSTPLDLF